MLKGTLILLRMYDRGELSEYTLSILLRDYTEYALEFMKRDSIQ